MTHWSNDPAGEQILPMPLLPLSCVVILSLVTRFLIVELTASMSGHPPTSQASAVSFQCYTNLPTPDPPRTRLPSPVLASRMKWACRRPYSHRLIYPSCRGSVAASRGLLAPGRVATRTDTSCPLSVRPAQNKQRLQKRRKGRPLAPTNSSHKVKKWDRRGGRTVSVQAPPAPPDLDRLGQLENVLRQVLSPTPPMMALAVSLASLGWTISSNSVTLHQASQTFRATLWKDCQDYPVSASPI
jgi:hypothetical protein